MKRIWDKIKIPELTYATLFEMIIGGTSVFTAQSILMKAAETDPKSTTTLAVIFSLCVLVLTKFKKPTSAGIESDIFKVKISSEKKGIPDEQSFTQPEQH